MGPAFVSIDKVAALPWWHILMQGVCPWHGDLQKEIVGRGACSSIENDAVLKPIYRFHVISLITSVVEYWCFI